MYVYFYIEGDKYNCNMNKIRSISLSAIFRMQKNDKFIRDLKTEFLLKARGFEKRLAITVGTPSRKVLPSLPKLRTCTHVR